MYQGLKQDFVSKSRLVVALGVEKLSYLTSNFLHPNETYPIIFQFLQRTVFRLTHELYSYQ